MSSREYREQGIAAAKARRSAEARKLLTQAVRLDPEDAAAWLFLASVTEDKKTRLLCLQRVLEIDPKNAMGIKAVQALGVDPAQLMALSRKKAQGTAPPRRSAQAMDEDTQSADLSAAPYESENLDDLRTLDEDPVGGDTDDVAAAYTIDDDPFDAVPRPAPPSAPPPVGDALADDDDFFDDDDDFPLNVPGDAPAAAPAPEAAAPAAAFVPPPTADLPKPPPVDQSQPGIPTPDLAYLEQVLVYAEAAGSRYAQPLDDGLNWHFRSRGRAGEGDLLRMRLQIYGSAAVIFIVLVVAGVALAFSNPSVRAALLPPTPTPTFTPTFTPTNTPGFTETPTATLDTTANPTYTPSPTLNPTFIPQAVIGISTPRPTVPYLPGQLEGSVLGVIALLESGQAADAVPTMERERALTSNQYDPNPYYYSALALAADDQMDRAFEVAAESETRAAQVSGADQAIFQAVVNLTYAELHVARARESLLNGQGAGDDLTLARERAQAAIDFDARYARAYVLIAQSHGLEGNLTEAISTLEQAQLVPGLADNNALITEKAALYLQRGREQLAAGDADSARNSFAAADQQAFIALSLNPYEERAHRLRIEAALARGEPGTAYLYTRDYRLAYPDSPTAFRYEGDARRAEGNLDLALTAYSRALNLGGSDTALVEVLLSRADLYRNQGRHALAVTDLTQALEIDPRPAIRAQRMEAAYAAGQYATARQDAQLLQGTGAVSAGALALLDARIVISEAETEGASTTQVEAALQSLNALDPTGLDAALIEEYRARAYLLLGDYENALSSADRAVSARESGTRYFLRGQAQLGLGTDLNAAIRDYEWVLAWDQLFSYPFAPQAAEGIEAARTGIVQTAQAQGTATAAAVTATAEAEASATQSAATTATAVFELTAAMVTPTATPTITPAN